MLSFGAPLWLLVAALGIGVLLLHVQRRRSFDVPSLMLWRRIASGSAQRKPLRPPPLSWALVLQLAVLVLAALALAEPMLAGQKAVHRIFVVEAPEEQALDASLARISQLLVAAPPETNNRVSLMITGAEPQILAARQAERAGLDNGLDRLRVQGGDIDVARTAELVGDLSSTEETTQVTLIAPRADQAAQDLLAALDMPAARLISLDQSAASLADLRVRIEPVDAGQGHWQATGSLTMAASATAPSSIHVLFRPDGSEGFLDWADLPLDEFIDDNGTKIAEFSTALNLPGGGVLTFQLPQGSGLSSPGVRFVLHNAPVPARILYLGGPTNAVVRALQAIPGTSLFQADTLPANTSDFDLVVLDDVAVAKRPNTNTLWLGSAHLTGESDPTPIQASVATDWQVEHALSQGVNWPSVRSIAGFVVPQLPGAEVLLAAPATPLVQARTTRFGREIDMALDLKAMAWVNEPGFLALMVNIMHWAEPRRQGVIDPPCLVGHPCAVPARALSGMISPVAESVLGASSDVSAAPASLLPTQVFQGDDGWLPPGMDTPFVPQQAGLYRISVPGLPDTLVAVNDQQYLSASPADSTSAGTEQPLATGWSLWWVLLAVAGLLLAVETALAAVSARQGAHLSALARTNPRWLRNRLVTLCVSGAVILLAAALVGVPLLRPVSSPRVVVRSVEPGQSLQSDSDELENTAVVAMGAGVETTADANAPYPLQADNAEAAPGGNVQDALMLAAALLPAGPDARIALDWNGNQTRGDLAGTMTALAARGIKVDVVAPGAAAADAVAVERVEAPAQTYAGDRFTVSAIVSSQTDRTASVDVIKDGAVIGNQQAQLAPGANRVDVAVEAGDEGQSLFEVAVADEADPVPANNRAGTWVDIVPPPKVAVISAQAGSADGFVEALSLQGLDVTALPAEQAPSTLPDWLSYDAVVLADVPASDFSVAQQGQLESAVAEHGRGLLLMGGPNSFGPGGYYETAFERLSPLSSRVPRNTPKTGFVFVLDRSGSMQRDEGGGLNRLAIAKSSTLNASGLLNPQSQFGIVAFDSAAHMVLPMQDAGDRASIVAALSQFDAAGGTSVYPGLAMAIKMLEGVHLPAKHIVVMSDGLTQPGDFAGLLHQANARDITVSTIAIGDGADPTSLSNIASLGGGAFHWSRDFRALPGIMAQEALMAATSPIEQRTVAPQWVDRSEDFLSAAPAAMPRISGYIDTTEKPRARLHLATTDADGNVVPIMASWQLGAGQVMALATEASGSWTSQWVANSDYPRFWSQIVRGFAPLPGASGPSIALSRWGDEIHVTVEQRDDEEAYDTTMAPVVSIANSAAPDDRMVNRPLQMTQASPGRFEGQFPVFQAGDYLVEAKAGETVASAKMHVGNLAYFNFRRARTDQLVGLAAATGGQLLQGPDAVLPRAAAHWAPVSAWRLWTALAVALFFLSLVFRYLPGFLLSRLPFVERSKRPAFAAG